MQRNVMYHVMYVVESVCLCVDAYRCVLMCIDVYTSAYLLSYYILNRNSFGNSSSRWFGAIQHTGFRSHEGTPQSSICRWGFSNDFPKKPSSWVRESLEHGDFPTVFACANKGPAAEKPRNAGRLESVRPVETEFRKRPQNPPLVVFLFS